MYYFFIIIIIIILIYVITYKQYTIKETFNNYNLTFTYPIKKHKSNWFSLQCMNEEIPKVENNQYYEKSKKEFADIIFKDDILYDKYGKYKDKYYGIEKINNNSKDYYHLQNKKIDNQFNKKIEFKQGNICQLSKWSNWSNCNKTCGKNYNKQFRTRTILNYPINCYSPSNPILKQTVECGKIPCFTQFTY